MKVIVDGDPTDQFGRPGEDQDLAEFIEEINDKLAETNRVLSDVRIDGDVLGEEHTSLKCREIDELEAEISTIEDLTIESIGELGSYAHRFLDRAPEILAEWEDITEDQIDTYRQQVVEALQATRDVLSSVDQLTNLDLEETARDEMIERAENLQERLEDADTGEIRAIIDETAKNYFESLLDTLQSVLDEFERRRESLLEKIDDIQEVLNDLREEVKTVVDKAQRQGESISDWLNMEKVGKMSEDLTKVNTILNELDQAGVLRTYFPRERHKQIQDTLEELREGIGRVFTLLEDKDPTQVVSVLRKEIEPYLDKAAQMFADLEPEEEPEPRPER